MAAQCINSCSHRAGMPCPSILTVVDCILVRFSPLLGFETSAHSLTSQLLEHAGHHERVSSTGFVTITVRTIENTLGQRVPMMERSSDAGPGPRMESDVAAGVGRVRPPGALRMAGSPKRRNRVSAGAPACERAPPVAARSPTLRPPRPPRPMSPPGSAGAPKSQTGSSGARSSKHAAESRRNRHYFTCFSTPLTR